MPDRDEISTLRDLLAQSEDRLRSSTNDDTWSRLSLPELTELVKSAQAELEQGGLSPATSSELWRAFAPTCDWDDVVGDTKLGNAVFELVDSIFGRPPPSRGPAA